MLDPSFGPISLNGLNSSEPTRPPNVHKVAEQHVHNTHDPVQDVSDDPGRYEGDGHGQGWSRTRQPIRPRTRKRASGRKKSRYGYPIQRQDPQREGGAGGPAVIAEFARASRATTPSSLFGTDSRTDAGQIFQTLGGTRSITKGEIEATGAEVIPCSTMLQAISKPV
jgi:hypothetical protein